MSSVSSGKPAALRVCARARELAGRLGERPGLEDLASDVGLDADHADAGKPASLLEDLAGAPDVHAELVVLQARRDVRVRLRVDVRVDPQGDPRRFARRPASASIFSISRSDSALKARIPAATPAAISSSVLPTPGEDDPVRGEPRTGGRRAARRPRRRPRPRRGPRGASGSRGSSSPSPRSRRGGERRRTRRRSGGSSPR